ncbi:hypothetical protein J5U21_01568 [Saccharolobus shibatae]|uniref:Uncharacterized protein n=1 Tax=Saccharolobus shibatae TaxID=2286 RepID=A0A8F5BUY1_9CREN|nr:hypothetical protein J5U21_01568 [Saccharolobus shibatae]
MIKLNNEYDIYRFSCSVGSKRFRMYFVFLGYYCCIEDFILKICNEQIREFIVSPLGYKFLYHDYYLWVESQSLKSVLIKRYKEKL